MPLTEEEITKIKVEYVHSLLDIIKVQDFKVYAVKLGRIMEMDKRLKADGRRTVITVSTEPWNEKEKEKA